MPQPNLTHLAIFAAVARHASFQKAAVEAGLSTSAVSHAVRGLEERLGVGLFNRTTRSVALTEAGQRLLDRLQPALRDVSDAIEEMNTFRDTPTGTLRINASRAGAEMLMHGLAARFLEAHPGIHFEVADTDEFVDIVAAGFDAGIRFMEAVPEDMIAVEIGAPCRWAVVATPDYFNRHGIPREPSALLTHNCVRHRFPSGRLFKWEFEKDGTALEVEVKGRLTVSNLDLALKAALDGLGIAVVFEDYAQDAIEDGQLQRVLEDWCPSFQGFVLYYPRQRRMSSALRAFIDMARFRPD